MGGAVSQVSADHVITLARALVVYQAALDWVSDTDSCHFCGYNRGRPLHDEDCPMVAPLKDAIKETGR